MLRIQHLLQACLLTCTLCGCLVSPEWQCRRSTDCSQDEFCRAGNCVPAQSGDRPDTGLQPDSAKIDDAEPLEPPRCEEGLPPEPGELVLNEVLVNVPTGSSGDANGDGIRDAYEDEFVEIVNLAEHILDLTGVSIANGSKSKFTFEADCLQPREAAVVFGGGMPAASADSLVRVASSRFAFGNNGGTVALFSEDGDVLQAFNYESSPPEALTLAPQLDGEQFVAHSELIEESLLSPGTCADGRAFAQGCREGEEE